jgi:tetratricopeptide (TPR) repeat protein
LAEDLERFLKDEPIRAKRPTLVQRMRKWSRRHKSVVRAAVAGVVLAAAALALSTFLVWREKEQTEAARARAEINFTRARDGIMRLLMLSEKRWKGVPQMQQALAEAGVGVFEGFLDEHNRDPAVRFQTGRAYLLIGNVYCAQFKVVEAAAARRKGIAFFEQLVADFPENGDYRQELAGAYYILGKQLNCFGDPGESVEACRKAGEQFRQALQHKADGRAYNNYADFLADCPHVSLREPGQAVVLAQQAVHLAPTKGIFWSTLGVAHYRVGNHAAAIAALEESIKRRDGNSYDWFFLAMAHWKQGDEEQSRQRYDQAVQRLNENVVAAQGTLANPYRLEAEALLGIRNRPATGQPRRNDQAPP